MKEIFQDINNTSIENYKNSYLKEEIEKIKNDEKLLEEILDQLPGNDKKITQLLAYGFFDEAMLQDRKEL